MGQRPDLIEEWIADIAAIFHWPLPHLEAMDLTELAMWRELAVKRWNRMNTTEK
ncbi:GpE family phage tail protein [Novosphingobium sp. KN65.2]|uniref:GpE family phage tail protein n=1 Tax=Novosphingobium sp. KN65.2 TaxID=1478134 RepID=UPI0035111B70